MSTIEQRDCRCGNEMNVKSTPNGAFYHCQNCDRNPKTKTALTRTYNEVLDRLSRGWYPKWAEGGKLEDNDKKTKKEENK